MPHGPTWDPRLPVSSQGPGVSSLHSPEDRPQPCPFPGGGPGQAFPRAQMSPRSVVSPRATLYRGQTSAKGVTGPKPGGAPWPHGHQDGANGTSPSQRAGPGWARVLQWGNLWVLWDVGDAFQITKSNMKEESDNKSPQSKGSLAGCGSSREAYEPDFTEPGILVLLGVLPILERAAGHTSISLSPVLESVSLTL